MELFLVITHEHGVFVEFRVPLSRAAYLCFSNHFTNAVDELRQLPVSLPQVRDVDDVDWRIAQLCRWLFEDRWTESASES